MLDFHRTVYSPIDTVEHDEQKVACSLNNSPSMSANSGINHRDTKRPQTRNSACVVTADETAVIDHVHVDDSYQLAAAWGTSYQISSQWT